MGNYLKRKYEIPGPLGSTHIETSSKCFIRYRGTILNTNKVYFERDTKKPCQLYLPFCYYSKIYTYIQRTEQTIEEILEMISNVRARQEPLLQFLINGGTPAIKLFKSCPAIVFLLAIHLSFIDDWEEYTKKVKDLFSLRHKDILCFCNYPSSPLTIKVLRRLPLKHICISTINEIKSILLRNDKKAINALGHLPTLNIVTINFLANQDIYKVATQGFYYEMCIRLNNKICKKEIYYVNEISKLSWITKCHKSERNLNNFLLKRFCDVRKIYNYLFEEIENLDLNNFYEDTSFGDAPIPSIEFRLFDQLYGIFPLHNGKALMKHKSASYFWKILKSNDVYAYHFSLPNEKKGSFLIKRYGDQWYLKEFGYVENGISAQVTNFINDWLASWYSNLKNGEK